LKVKIDYFRQMKNQFLLFLCLLFSLFSFSQKKYSFDYMIEYDFQGDESSKMGKVYFLTNSKDNAYLLKATEVDSGYVNLDFFDDKGLYSKSSLKKEAFFEFRNLDIKCEFVNSYIEKGKYETKNFKYLFNQDTIFNGVLYKVHRLKFNSKKRTKQFDGRVANYIVEPNTDFHKPLVAFSFSFDLRIRSSEIPNGIAKEIYTTNFRNYKLFMIFKLKNFSKIEKSLTIPKECCLTN